MVRFGLAAAAMVVAGLAAAAPAHALSMSECSAKYKQAQSDGSLKGMKWNDFRKAECGATATDAKAAGEPTMATTENAKEPPAPTMKAPAGVKFPSAIDPKYAKETPGKARMHTCLDQYHAAKAANGLNGLKWIQKGGGYYSLCNAKLKG